MARSNSLLLALNRGEVSKLALARVDVEKLRMAAACQLNWQPSVLGPMSLRGGLNAVGEVLGDNPAKLVRFVFSKLDTALLELTNGQMRVWLTSGGAETLLSRAAVGTVVTNGAFGSSSGWTLVASAGATTSISGGFLTLAPSVRGALCTATQALSIAAPDQNVEQALRITVANGPVVFRCGTSSGSDEYIGRTSLDTGTHSLAFTPTGASAYIQFEAASTGAPTCQTRYVTGCAIEAAGAVSIPTNWLTQDLPNIRYDQSGDIIFVAAYGKQQGKIERRAAHSWSVVTYYSQNGPFDTGPFSDAKLTLSAVDGNGTLTADKNTFKPGHVGAQFSLFTSGQVNTWQLGGADSYTDAVRVAGVQADRKVSEVFAGTWAGTLTVQRSLTGPTTGFSDIPGNTFTTNGTSTVDGATGTNPYDNVIVWYRVGFKPGQYTSGVAQVTLSILTGGGTAICRVIGYNSPTSVNVEILSSPSAAGISTADWAMSLWGDPSVANWPTSVVFHEGRLWWFGPDTYGSESNAYYLFRAQDVYGNSLGDAAAIIERFGSGPADTVSWGLSLTRLLLGREQSIASARSSNFDQALTAALIVIRDCSDQGAQRLPAIKVGKRGIFVQQSGRKVYELAFNGQEMDYGDRDLTRLNLDIGLTGFVDIDHATQPDKMIWLPRGDGQCASLLYDVDDDVIGWWRLQTLGIFENAAVLPAAGIEDISYHVVRRVVSGVTRRFIEKLAPRASCVGGALNQQLDCALTYVGPPVSTLQHPFLVNSTITVWADGANLGTAATDSSGHFTMPDGLAHSNVVYGLGGLVVSTVSSTPVGTLTVGNQYNGYPCEVFADVGSTGRIKRVGPLTVSGGVISLPNFVTATSIYAYLGFVAPFFSAKLVASVPGLNPINVREKLDRIGLVLYDTASVGLQFGQTPAQLDSLPQVEAEENVSAVTVWPEYEEPVFTLSGEWDSDARLFLLAQAPNPCTVGAVAIEMSRNAG